MAEPVVKPHKRLGLPPWLRDRRLWILVAATLMGLTLAWTVKAPCVENNWDGLQYRRLCYNDIQPLYGVRHMDKDVVPYINDTVRPGGDPDVLEDRLGFLEYPVLTGIVMHLAARLSDSGTEFFVWNAVILSGFAVATTFLLFHVVDDKRRIALFALGPPLFLYAFHNWDLIAVFFTVLAIYYQQRNDALGSGIALGLGASAKMYPAFLAPGFGLAILRRERGLGPDSWRFGLGFFGAVALVNAPFFFANRELFLETYRFHLRRTPNFETTWYVIAHYGRKWNVDWMTEAAAKDTLSIIVPLGLLAVLGGMGWLVWRGRLGAIEGSLAGLLAFMVFNKIFSVQYALWILPFFAILHLDVRKFTAYVTTDLMVYLAIFTFFLHAQGPQNPKYFDYVGVSVLARTAVLAWLLVVVLRWNRRVEPAPPAPVEPEPLAG